MLESNCAATFLPPRAEVSSWNHLGGVPSSPLPRSLSFIFLAKPEDFSESLHPTTISKRTSRLPRLALTPKPSEPVVASENRVRFFAFCSSPPPPEVLSPASGKALSDFRSTSHTLICQNVPRVIRLPRLPIRMPSVFSRVSGWPLIIFLNVASFSRVGLAAQTTIRRLVGANTRPASLLGKRLGAT